ncbi:MAG: hypothetical protein M3348_01675 [Acidobacteriota bacterium]|nr:hypothetical protein [Acidobacteriota bacterium]
MFPIFRKLLSHGVPFVAGFLAYFASHAMPFLEVLRGVLALYVGQQFASWVAQPGIFAPLCGLLVALIQAAWRLVIHFTNNDWRARALSAERKLAPAVRQGLVK